MVCVLGDVSTEMRMTTMNVDDASPPCLTNSGGTQAPGHGLKSNRTSRRKPQLLPCTDQVRTGKLFRFLIFSVVTTLILSTRSQIIVEKSQQIQMFSSSSLSRRNMFYKVQIKKKISFQN